MNVSKDRLFRSALKLYVDTGGKHLNVSDLAKEAGVARGTVYNNITDLDGYFDMVATRIREEMSSRLEPLVHERADPAMQLAAILRSILEGVHEDRLMGQFLLVFSMNEPILRKYWAGQPADTLRSGVESGRFLVEENMITTSLAQIAGAAFSVMILVINGRKSWREAGFELTFIQLRAFGLSGEDATEIARSEFSLAD